MSRKDNLKLLVHRVGPDIEYEDGFPFPVIRKANGVLGWPVQDSGPKESEKGYYIHIPLTNIELDYVGISLTENQLVDMLLAVQDTFYGSGKNT